MFAGRFSCGSPGRPANPKGLPDRGAVRTASGQRFGHQPPSPSPTHNHTFFYKIVVKGIFSLKWRFYLAISTVTRGFRRFTWITGFILGGGVLCGAGAALLLGVILGIIAASRGRRSRRHLAKCRCASLSHRYVLHIWRHIFSKKIEAHFRHMLFTLGHRAPRLSIASGMTNRREGECGRGACPSARQALWIGDRDATI